MNEPRRGLSGSALKLIAIAAMTIDHATWVFLPGYRTDALTLSLHLIGRLTAPIMMFFIVEGYFRTRSVKKYIQRMFLWALLSHFTYALLFEISFVPHGIVNQTSVMWTFALGLTALAISKSEHPKLKRWHKIALVWLCALAAFPADWSTPAAVSILHMGLNRGRFKKQVAWFVLYMAMYAAVYAIWINPVYGLLQMGVVLAIPLWKLYNGKRGAGGKAMKWFFYAYYPGHMLILALLRILLQGR